MEVFGKTSTYSPKALREAMETVLEYSNPDNVSNMGWIPIPIDNSTQCISKLPLNGYLCQCGVFMETNSLTTSLVPSIL